ncbi:trypsin-like peptidase domain-containing protein [uncultured Tyzzerella sp.]|uniref:S1C family serine protease n=1 Tax=uncultured Tyzzerella sp. TaxID=2321398 RepID=UPI002943A313|nr:trypsin-like peptidase domain-containing protein [uncultured Tyzzerella sp.]
MSTDNKDMDNNIENNIVDMDNNIENNIVDMDNDDSHTSEENTLYYNEIKKEQIKSLIAREKEQKKQENKKRRRKAAKVILKSGAVASCCLFLGVGIGTGAIVSKNFISKREQTNFKFNVSDLSQASLKDNVILTSNSASSIFKEVGDSVVNISTKSSGGFFYSELKDLGSGSGIIYKIDGDKVYILTNNHVIQGASYVTISVTGEEQVEANLVGTDPSSDLAVLSVSKKDMHNAGIKEVRLAKFADSDSVEVGDFVFPIGNALGRGKTMTQGMISAQNKQINIDGKNLTVIQTDAAINPGNSGGALMNSDGEVVGINTAKLSSSAIEGIGYAIPSNIAIDIADQIINNGYVARPYFGIMGKTITEKAKLIYNLNVNGVIVVEVEKGSNAEKSGIKEGDIITSFNGEKIETVDDLSIALNKCKPNDTVSFEVVREGNKPMSLKVVLIPSKTSF